MKVAQHYFRRIIDISDISDNWCKGWVKYATSTGQLYPGLFPVSKSFQRHGIGIDLRDEVTPKINRNIDQSPGIEISHNAGIVGEHNCPIDGVDELPAFQRSGRLETIVDPAPRPTGRLQLHVV